MRPCLSLGEEISQDGRHRLQPRRALQDYGRYADRGISQIDRMRRLDPVRTRWCRWWPGTPAHRAVKSVTASAQSARFKRPRLGPPDAAMISAVRRSPSASTRVVSPDNRPHPAPPHQPVRHHGRLRPDRPVQCTQRIHIPYQRVYALFISSHDVHNRTSNVSSWFPYTFWWRKVLREKAATHMAVVAVYRCGGR